MDCLPRHREGAAMENDCLFDWHACVDVMGSAYPPTEGIEVAIAVVVPPQHHFQRPRKPMEGTEVEKPRRK